MRNLDIAKALHRPPLVHPATFISVPLTRSSHRRHFRRVKLAPQCPTPVLGLPRPSPPAAPPLVSLPTSPLPPKRPLLLPLRPKALLITPHRRPPPLHPNPLQSPSPLSMLLFPSSTASSAPWLPRFIPPFPISAPISPPLPPCPPSYPRCPPIPSVPKHHHALSSYRCLW